MAMRRHGQEWGIWSEDDYNVTGPWKGHKGPFGRNVLWQYGDREDLQIRHCGHPTANFPYYVVGIEEIEGATFRHLKAAQTAVEIVMKREFDKLVLDVLKADRDPAHWKPPRWIWTTLVAMKVAALAALVIITAVVLNT